MITRRQAIHHVTTATVAIAAAPLLTSRIARAADAPPVAAYTLPKLPYSFDALEPHIDARTMEIHHDKHHAAYVTNLNKALANAPELAKKSVDDLIRTITAVPADIRTAVRNHGGGHANHSLFWQVMSKSGGGEPKGELARAINTKFGSFATFKDEFTKAALGQFGSGWAWLSWDKNHVRVEATGNQDSPLMHSWTPLLGIDVWEHAYYLKYQNKRADYIAAFFNVINWDFVTERFAKAQT